LRPQAPATENPLLKLIAILSIIFLVILLIGFIVWWKLAMKEDQFILQE
jgi:preprotein translocase subunit SecG